MSHTGLTDEQVQEMRAKAIKHMEREGQSSVLMWVTADGQCVVHPFFKNFGDLVFMSTVLNSIVTETLINDRRQVAQTLSIVPEENK